MAPSYQKENVYLYAFKKGFHTVCKALVKKE